MPIIFTFGNKHMAKKKIIVSVTNDLTTDQRVAKICDTLSEMEFEVVLVGRKLKNSQPLNRYYRTKRFNLWFNKGALFYANYNTRLFFYLLFSTADFYWSNDLDTLLANHFASKWKKKKLIFDSHEYFTEVPELINRPKVQRFWKKIERKILPKLSNSITVSQSIADLYKKEYKISVKILRNIPTLHQQKVEVENLSVKGKKILIYQGAININRGIEYMVEAMKYMDNSILVLVGKGDISNKIEKLIVSNQLDNKVKMLGEVPYEKLYSYTIQADLGLSLEEDAGLNYRYALPNKLFNYIHAHIPVLVSNLPEMKNLVNNYQVGEVIDSYNPKDIAEKIKNMLESNNYSRWVKNCKKTTLELNWENEKQVIKDLF